MGGVLRRLRPAADPDDAADRVPGRELFPESIDGRPLDQFFDDWCTFCVPANLTGQPAASVPIGADEDGLPIGLQIIGRRWEDLTVLAAAAQVERLLP